MGFCPPGFLSSLDFVRLDIVLWVFVQWDFVLIPSIVYEYCLYGDNIVKVSGEMDNTCYTMCLYEASLDTPTVCRL